MGAPDVLARVAAAGIKLTPLPDGRILAGPSSRLTDELRALIRAHKPELLAALATGALADTQAEARRQRLQAEPTKPTKAPFVSAPSKRIPEIELGPVLLETELRQLIGEIATITGHFTDADRVEALEVALRDPLSWRDYLRDVLLPELTGRVTVH